jgi:hypothetical protein
LIRDFLGLDLGWKVGLADLFRLVRRFVGSRER